MQIDKALNLRYGGIALMCVGPGLLLIATFGALRAWEINNWPATTAQVVSRDVEVSKKVAAFSMKGRTRYRDYFTSLCTYSYQVKGQTFTNTKACAEGFDPNEVELSSELFPIGGEITIWHSARYPKNSVLKRDVDLVGLALMFGFGVIAFPIGLMLKRYADKIDPALPVENIVSCKVASPVLPATPKAGILSRSQHAKQSPSQTERPSLVKQLLRGMAVCLGLLLFVCGGLFTAASIGQMAQGANAPAAAKVGLGVQMVATTIFASISALGGYMVWLGVRRTTLKVNPNHLPGPTGSSVRALGT